MRFVLLIGSVFSLFVWPTRADGNPKRYIITPIGISGMSSPDRAGSVMSMRSAAEARSLEVVKELSHSGAIVIRSSDAERIRAQFGSQFLIEEDTVFSVSPIDSRAPSQSEITAIQFTQQIDYGVQRVGSFASGSKGEGVIVCVSDTGIDLNHPDLKANIIANFNAIDPNLTGNDDNGHGSHVAGTIAAINNAVGVAGVAPKAKLIAAKGLNAAGSGFSSDLVETIDGCVQRGAQVINMSWGSATANNLIRDALQRAADAGVVLVAAAGNSSTATQIAPVGFPAAFPTVIAVSAIDSSDRIATFSNQGPEIAFAAPGVAILSTYMNGGYRSLNGTSMASPHVAGVAALYLSKNPGATRDQVRAGIGASSIGLTANQQGRGLVSSVLSTR